MFSVHTQIRRGHGKLYSVFLLFSCLMCLFLLCSLLLFIFFFLLFLLIGSSLFSSLVRCTVLCYICLHLVHIFIIHTNCDKIGQRAQFAVVRRGVHSIFIGFSFRSLFFFCSLCFWLFSGEFAMYTCFIYVINIINVVCMFLYLRNVCTYIECVCVCASMRTRSESPAWRGHYFIYHFVPRRTRRTENR